MPDRGRGSSASPGADGGLSCRRRRATRGEGAREADVGEDTGVLRIVAGEVEAGLVPAMGGSVAWLRWRGRELMRPLSEADRLAGNVLGVGCFPMLPYANRIAGNAFDFDGRS